MQVVWCSWAYELVKSFGRPDGSGIMQHPECDLPRTPLLGTLGNKGKKKGRGYYAPAQEILSLAAGLEAVTVRVKIGS